MKIEKTFTFDWVVGTSQSLCEFSVQHLEEEQRKEREASATEGGWTVVVHHKGMKKTTDSENGIVVGSVAQAAVEKKVAKKKHKEVGLDFYQFQKKEAKRTGTTMNNHLWCGPYYVFLVSDSYIYRILFLYQGNMSH